MEPRITEERHYSTVALSEPPVLGRDSVSRITVVDGRAARVAPFAVVRSITLVTQLPKAFYPVPEGEGRIVLNADGGTRRTP